MNFLSFSSSPLPKKNILSTKVEKFNNEIMKDP